MPRDTVAYSGKGNSFQKFLSLTDEKEVLGKEILGLCKPTDKRLLDVGAGDGSLTKMFGGQFLTVHLIEPSAVLAEKIQRDLPRAKVINQKVEDVDLPLNFYDLIVVSHSIHYVEDPKRLMSRLLGSLRNGSRIIVIMTDDSGDYTKYVDEYRDIVSAKNKYKFRWNDLRKILEKQRIAYSIQDVEVTVTCSSVEEFMSMNDFHFNVDVSNLSQEVMESMREYLQRYMHEGEFRIEGKNKLFVITKK